jgi:hypothetical protein
MLYHRPCYKRSRDLAYNKFVTFNFIPTFFRTRRAKLQQDAKLWHFPEQNHRFPCWTNKPMTHLQTLHCAYSVENRLLFVQQGNLWCVWFMIRARWLNLEETAISSTCVHLIARPVVQHTCIINIINIRNRKCS